MRRSTDPCFDALAALRAGLVASDTPYFACVANSRTHSLVHTSHYDFRGARPTFSISTLRVRTISMKRTLSSAVSLAALQLTGWAAARAQRRSPGTDEPRNMTLLGLAIVALAASLGYKK